MSLHFEDALLFCSSGETGKSESSKSASYHQTYPKGEIDSLTEDKIKKVPLAYRSKAFTGNFLDSDSIPHVTDCAHELILL